MYHVGGSRVFSWLLCGVRCGRGLEPLPLVPLRVWVIVSSVCVGSEPGKSAIRDMREVSVARV